MSAENAATLGVDAYGNQAGTELAQPALDNGRYQAVKRMLDVALAACFVFCSLPLLIVVWLLVRCDGGPGLYGHERIGRGQLAFRCLKFRTMVVDADRAIREILASDGRAAEQWMTLRKLDPDPRVTRLGRFLRRTSLDELPQLINVLRGDMSLVGPRPVVADELTDHYAPASRAAYLSLRPGLTGLWQIGGRSEVSYETRVRLDTQYAREASFLLDAKVMLSTIHIVLFQRGAR